MTQDYDWSESEPEGDDRWWDGNEVGQTDDVFLAGPTSPSIVVGMDGSPGASWALDWAGSRPSEWSRTYHRRRLSLRRIRCDVLTRADAQRVVEQAAGASPTVPSGAIKSCLSGEPAAHPSSMQAEAPTSSWSGRGLRGIPWLIVRVGRSALPVPRVMFRGDYSRSEDARLIVRRRTPRRSPSESTARTNGSGRRVGRHEAPRMGAELEVVGSSVSPGLPDLSSPLSSAMPEAAKQVVSDAWTASPRWRRKWSPRGDL